MPNVDPPLETEWQFATDDLASVRDWLERQVSHDFRVESGPERVQHDCYWDTASWLVWRAGYACRIRYRGDDVELTLKGLFGGEGHLRQRVELNEAFDPHRGLDATVAAPTGEASRLLRMLAGPHMITQVAALTTYRQIVTVSDEAGPLAEVALDRTTVGEGPRAHELLRVEVEVGAAVLERAEPFVTALREGADLQPAFSGKLTAALAAANASPGWEPQPLGPMTVQPDSSLGEVGYAVLRREFLRLVEHEPVARLGDDIEGVHQMRVACRRMRTALDLFAKALPDDLVEQRRELRWLARALGDVRDLDVQRERLKGASEAIGEEAVAALDAILLERRSPARTAMLAVLDSERYVALSERMSTLLRAGIVTAGQGTDPARAAAPDLIRRRQRHLKRDGKHIQPSSSPTAFHALRLRAKRLRYALEFFAPLYGRAARLYIRRIAQLQELLGAHNDAIVAADLYEELARQAAASTDAATTSVAEATRSLATAVSIEAERAREDFPRRFRRVSGAHWQELRASWATRAAIREPTLTID